MRDGRRDQLHVSAGHQPVFRELGIDAPAVFAHPLIQPWRELPDRDNCTLDARLADGRAVRWHVKRYERARGRTTPADDEVRGHRMLLERGVPTFELVAWGNLADGRSFVILDDLNGFEAADKLVEAGLAFDRLLEPTARLAAKLHASGLHHRDLYLCHFFARVTEASVDLRLIDTARVRPLPRFFGGRWVVKDLAQFWYSTTNLDVNDQQRTRWLDVYATARSIGHGTLRAKIERKVNWIARHDARVRRRQPLRNISIPGSTSPSPQASSEGTGGNAA